MFVHHGGAPVILRSGQQRRWVDGSGQAPPRCKGSSDLNSHNHSVLNNSGEHIHKYQTFNFDFCLISSECSILMCLLMMLSFHICFSPSCQPPLMFTHLPLSGSVSRQVRCSHSADLRWLGEIRTTGSPTLLWWFGSVIQPISMC